MTADIQDWRQDAAKLMNEKERKQDALAALCDIPKATWSRLKLNTKMAIINDLGLL